MLTRPAVEDAEIAALLAEAYGITPLSIAFLPIGADPAGTNFRIASVEATYFLKLRTAMSDHVAADVSRWLHESGILDVVAPLRTCAGDSAFRSDHGIWLLYPFVDAPSGFTTPLSKSQWTALGACVRAVHDAALPGRLVDSLRHEDYAPRWRDAARAIDARLRAPAPETTTAHELAALWSERGEEIRSMIDRAEVLSATMRSRNTRLVVCHADLHAGNVLVRPDDRIGVVDWDDVMLAPPERDLMFIGGGVGGVWNEADEVAWFFEGYGEVEVAPTALAYYRYERIVTDLVVSAEAIVDGTASPEDQATGLRHAREQFLPENVVDLAHRTYSRL